MPSLLIFATADDDLAAAWERQLPPGRSIVRLTPQSFPAGSRPGFSAVVILDATAETQVPAMLAGYPTIYVGEPRSLPFEQARLAHRAKVYLSYEESAHRLSDFVGLLEELAEKQSMVEILVEKNRRNEVPRQVPKPTATDTIELWDFIEGAVENLDMRDRLIAEFRRASRQLLRASHTVFFLREGDGFRADRGTSYFGLDDPLVAFLETHPVVIDEVNGHSPADPVAELALRNRLAMWGARLLVPVHDNGRLLGLIALGVRDDGQAYDDADRTRAVFFARLLRHFLSRSAQIGRFTHLTEQTALGAKYLPNTLLLAAGEMVPRHVPLVVRDIIGRVRRTREVCRVSPEAGQPFRASAGLVAENSGVWAFWEEASTEVHDAHERSREARRGLLRELALTLSHELGNALVSLATFRQLKDRPLTSEMQKSLRADIGHLEKLNQRLELMQRLDETEPTDTDLCTLARKIGGDCGIAVDVMPEAVRLHVAASLLEFAFTALIETLLENQQGAKEPGLTLQLRATGSGDELTALWSLKGRNLELEGILPEPIEGAVPNQGRMAVFLAKEILRLHRGEIHAGPGLHGTEILISLRSC